MEYGQGIPGKGKAELVKALAAAKSEFPRIEKTATANIQTKTGGKYSYSYATLDVVRGVCDPILAKHGLVVLHTTTMRDNGQLLLATTLWHESGQSMESFWPLVANLGDPQAVGSAMTYAERYTYCAIIGIAAGDDDDGAKATQQAKKEATRQKPQAKPSRTSNNGNGETQRGKRTRGIVVDLAQLMEVDPDMLEAFGKDKNEFSTTAKATLTFKQAIENEEKRQAVLNDFNVWLLAQEPPTSGDEEMDFDTLISQVATAMEVDDEGFGGWVATHYEEQEEAEKDLKRALAYKNVLKALKAKFMPLKKEDLFQGGK